MTTKIPLTHAMVDGMVRAMASLIEKTFPVRSTGYMGRIAVYPIPRGGIPVAYLYAAHRNIRIVDNPLDAEIFVDNIIDSGRTMQSYCDKYPGKPFFALIDKSNADYHNNPDIKRDSWVIFPWEETAEGQDVLQDDIVIRLLEAIGEDPNREGLSETPKRVMKAWKHHSSGYGANIAEILKVFEDGAERYDEMVVVKDIPIFSRCEHHLEPIFGTATIAYIPKGKIVGLSKLSRVADAFARRLQVQERLTCQIADALVEHLQPKGVGVVIKARHFCMESRGVMQQGHHTVTSALRGVLKTEPAARAEFLQLVNGSSK